MELRSEMTAAAEERIIAVTSQKEANLNVQQVVERHTRELKVSTRCVLMWPDTRARQRACIELVAN